MTVKNVMPDYSLIRDGIALDEWLWKLVDESQGVRKQAGEALQAMDWGLPSVHTDWASLAAFPDAKSQRVRFATGVKEAVGKPDFDAALFIEKLGALRLSMDADWKERVSKSMSRNDVRGDKYERIADRLVQTINSADETTTKSLAINRFARLTAIYICGSCNQEDDPFANAEAMSSSAMAASRVFDLLDIEFMTAPAVLDAFLSHPNLRRDALSAIARIGPAAMPFASRFIRELDEMPHGGKRFHWFDADHALGAIGVDDPLIVHEMVIRLSHGDSMVRRSAARVLQNMELAVCNRHQEICDLLVPLLANEDEWAAGLSALASVGRNLPSIRARILALAAPREMKPRVHVDFPDMEYDLTMHERGEAISAMKYFVEYPDECMPALIEAMKSFDEYDPDECYAGPLGRISTVVAQFGAGAEPAVASLVAHLNDEPDEPSTSIVEALASIGPAAKAALPALHEVRKQWSYEEDGDVETEIIDKDIDRFGWAIQQIQGVPSR